MTTPATVPLVAARDVLVVREGRAILDVPTLDVMPGEILAVIGPNGAGKSTLLRVLALLERPARGTVAFRGVVPRSEAERLAWRRRMASVFQEPLLCRGSVAANARLALRFRAVPPESAGPRAQAWLDRLGIAHLADRSVAGLSGGEAQRTSLARALATDPEVLFLDEPFAALDPSSRDALLDDLGRLLGATRTTTVFVTHERGEALRFGDRVAVMLEGRIAQVDIPEAVFGAPCDEVVARFVGVENLLPGRVAETREGLCLVTSQGHSLVVAGTVPVGEPVLVALRPEDLILEPTGARGPSSAQNRLEGRVAELTSRGPLIRVAVDCGPRLSALVTRPAVLGLALRPGLPITVTFKATAAHLIRRGS